MSEADSLRRNTILGMSSSVLSGAPTAPWFPPQSRPIVAALFHSSEHHLYGRPDAIAGSDQGADIFDDVVRALGLSVRRRLQRRMLVSSQGIPHKIFPLSLPRKRGSRATAQSSPWTPAFAGVTRTWTCSCSVRSYPLRRQRRTLHSVD